MIINEVKISKDLNKATDALYKAVKISKEYQSKLDQLEKKAKSAKTDSEKRNLVNQIAQAKSKFKDAQYAVDMAEKLLGNVLTYDPVEDLDLDESVINSGGNGWYLQGILDSINVNCSYLKSINKDEFLFDEYTLQSAQEIDSKLKSVIAYICSANNSGDTVNLPTINTEPFALSGIETLLPPLTVNKF